MVLVNCSGATGTNMLAIFKVDYGKVRVPSISRTVGLLLDSFVCVFAVVPFGAWLINTPQLRSGSSPLTHSLTLLSPLHKRSKGSEYVGEWQGNVMHGNGTRRFKNGDVYIGTYASGKRAGEGRFYFANGDMYYGNWEADQIHGFGRYYYNSGISFEGTFNYGRRHGKGKLQKRDGELEIYRYENNVRTDPGVRWSADRTKAWRLEGGRIKRSITIAEAVSIGYQCEGTMEDSRAVSEDIANLSVPNVS